MFLFVDVLLLKFIVRLHFSTSQPILPGFRIERPAAMKARQVSASVSSPLKGQNDGNEERFNLLHSLLRQKTKQLEIISKEASEQRRQLTRKNQIISDYESMFEQLRVSKERDCKLLKDELIYRNNVIQSQLETIEKLRIKIRKMDSLIPLNQYEAAEDEQFRKYRARAKGISAEPANEQISGMMAKNIEVCFVQKKQRFVRDKLSLFFNSPMYLQEIKYRKLLRLVQYRKEIMLIGLVYRSHHL